MFISAPNRHEPSRPAHTLGLERGVTLHVGGGEKWTRQVRSLPQRPRLSTREQNPIPVVTLSFSFDNRSSYVTRPKRASYVSRTPVSPSPSRAFFMAAVAHPAHICISAKGEKNSPAIAPFTYQARTPSPGLHVDCATACVRGSLGGSDE